MPQASIEIGRRFSRNAETDLVCRLLLEKKNKNNNLLHDKVEIYHLQLSQTHSFNFFFFFNHNAPPHIYTLSLHDALPIYHHYRTQRPAYEKTESLPRA